MKFEWNTVKATSNQQKHGVTFQEAMSVFQDSLSFTYPDFDHSVDEERYLIIGMSINRQTLVVSHIFRGNIIRIISARKATRKEQYFYEYENRH